MSRRLLGACKIGDFLLVKQYINEGDDPSYYDDIIIDACVFGYLNIVKLLLKDKRVDPSVQADIALQNACKNGHAEVVELLLTDSRVNPSTWNNLPIRSALKDNNIKIIKLLLKNDRFELSHDLTENEIITDCIYQIRQEKLETLVQSLI